MTHCVHVCVCCCSWKLHCQAAKREITIFGIESLIPSLIRIDRSMARARPWLSRRLGHCVTPPLLDRFQGASQITAATRFSCHVFNSSSLKPAQSKQPVEATKPHVTATNVACGTVVFRDPVLRFLVPNYHEKTTSFGVLGP